MSEKAFDPDDASTWKFNPDDMRCRHGKKGWESVWCPGCFTHAGHGSEGVIVLSCPVCIEKRKANPDYKPPTTMDAHITEELADAGITL